MSTQGLVIGIVVLLVAVAVIAAVAYTRRRTAERVREHFGPEYDRAVREYGDEKLAVEQLKERQERVEELDIRPLSSADRVRYAQAWQRAQARFVDDPAAAITEADGLVQEVMQARGYPMGNFDQRAADVSVHHPHVVEHYRAAHEISGRNRAGKATTEDLRQAMVHFRALFEELLEAPVAAATARGGGQSREHEGTQAATEERRAA